MPKNELDGLPVIDADETEKITVAVRAGDMQEGDPKDPERHPIAIALRRQPGVDDARVTEGETLIRRGKRWFRFEPPNKQLFKRLQKTLTAE
jgi:hypothetical protein